MPMYGYSKKRRYSSSSLRRSSLASAMRAASVLRAVGSPPLAHTFARPGERIIVTQRSVAAGSQYQALGPGMQFGVFSPGVVMNTWSGGFTQTFAFNMLTQFSDLANLYDNYRIKAIKLKIDLSYNNADNETSGSGLSNIAHAMPFLHYAIDPDDNSVPASASDVLVYSKSRSVRLGDKSVYINFVPRAQGVVAASTTSGGGVATNPIVGNMMPLNTWFDCNNAQTVPHFAVKYFLENAPQANYSTTPPSSNPSWAMYITPIYVLECKNVH